MCSEPVGSGPCPGMSGHERPPPGEDGLHSVQSLPGKERAAQKPLSAAFMARLQKLPGSIVSREFWASLPVSTRLFLVWSVLDAVMVVYYSIWQFRDVSLRGASRGAIPWALFRPCLPGLSPASQSLPRAIVPRPRRRARLLG